MLVVSRIPQSDDHSASSASEGTHLPARGRLLDPRLDDFRQLLRRYRGFVGRVENELPYDGLEVSRDEILRYVLNLHETIEDLQNEVVAPKVYEVMYRERWEQFDNDFTELHQALGWAKRKPENIHEICFEVERILLRVEESIGILRAVSLPDPADERS